MTDLQLPARDPDGFQVLKRFLRHAVRQFDQAVAVEDRDLADVLGFQSGFVGDRTDDIVRFDRIVMADFDPVGAGLGLGFALILAFLFRFDRFGF